MEARTGTGSRYRLFLVFPACLRERSCRVTGRCWNGLRLPGQPQRRGLPAIFLQEQRQGKDLETTHRRTAQRPWSGRWYKVTDDLNCSFCTEFGVYFSLNGGLNWMKLNGGMPTIPVRDITHSTQGERSGGCDFRTQLHVLDDISPLRAIDQDLMAQERLPCSSPGTPGGSSHVLIWTLVRSRVPWAMHISLHPTHHMESTLLTTEMVPDSLKEKRLAVEKKRSKLAVPFAGYRPWKPNAL